MPRAPRPPEELLAGRVGRAHGLDGSFHVIAARPALLVQGAQVTVGAQRARVERRAGTEQRPIVRLEGFSSREAAGQLRGAELFVDRDQAPALGEQEWWAEELAGCRVHDGPREVGVVVGLLALPSCEALEVRRPRGGELLVPMVRDAIREVDVEGRRVEVDLGFLDAEGEPGS